MFNNVVVSDQCAEEEGEAREEAKRGEEK